MNVFSVKPGDGPVVLSQPHGGTHVPDSLAKRLNAVGQQLTDTDWHINRLYAGLLPGATVIESHIHRYVIDANRDPDGVSLYPGQNTTSLCPMTDFDGKSIWRDRHAPSEDEVLDRVATFHAPYHAALAEELARVKARHGVAILYDCHSIRSHIAFLFDGQLPIFNVGTNDGTTCATEISDAVTAPCVAAGQTQFVLNGRFKGGWTTRHYGRPDTGVHAVQMETAQRAYMDEAAPWAYRPEKAKQVRAVFRTILANLDAMGRNGTLSTSGVAHA